MGSLRRRRLLTANLGRYRYLNRPKKTLLSQDALLESDVRLEPRVRLIPSSLHDELYGAGVCRFIDDWGVEFHRRRRCWARLTSFSGMNSTVKKTGMPKNMSRKTLKGDPDDDRCKLYGDAVDDRCMLNGDPDCVCMAWMTTHSTGSTRVASKVWP